MELTCYMCRHYPRSLRAICSCGCHRPHEESYQNRIDRERDEFAARMGRQTRMMAENDSTELARKELELMLVLFWAELNKTPVGDTVAIKLLLQKYTRNINDIHGLKHNGISCHECNEGK